VTIWTSYKPATAYDLEINPIQTTLEPGYNLLKESIYNRKNK